MGYSHIAKKKEPHGAMETEMRNDGDGVTTWAWRWPSRAARSDVNARHVGTQATATERLQCSWSLEVFLTLSLSLSLSHSLICYFYFWKMKMWLLCCLFYELLWTRLKKKKKRIICGPCGVSMSGLVVIAFSLLTFLLNINYIIIYCDYLVVYSSTD